MSNIMDVVRKGEIYLTFVFDGVDSTQMGIVSVASGSMYDTPVLPNFNDNFLDVDGYNGRYYFNTRIPSRDFKFTCFIDNLSAFELDSIKAWLHPNKIGKLIVPENPYRYYWVKVSSVGNLGNIPLTHPDTGSVSYTGLFDITFTTVGQVAGYGMLYYADDLKYYEYRDIFRDIFKEEEKDNITYDAGLLYREESLPLSHILERGTYKYRIYNPGTYDSKPIIKLLAKDDITTGMINIINETTGDLSVITLAGMMKDSLLVIDYAKNEYLLDGIDVSKRVVGDLLYFTPRDYIERINSVDISNDGTNTRITFDKLTRQVRSGDIGKTVMFKDTLNDDATDGAGGVIINIDKDSNSFILAQEYGLWTNPNVNVIITRTDDLKTEVDLPDGIQIELQYEILPRYI